ncbi:MAG TPA: PIG-L family deacetylase [Bryobacterales bacterium]|nr:PIG-L family deacetylase [Bryobacterales bacterium]
MDRHSIFTMPALAGAAFAPAAAAAPAAAGEVVVVKDEPGQPHRGKVFAAIHAHLDDIPYYASGLCAKLMSEGYTGYVIRTSNDERCGGHSTAENIFSNEQDHLRMAAVLGFRDVFDFYYQNHDMDGISYVDLRGRLILIFRMLKVDTIISFNPWGHGEENPDHWVTGRAVEEACWMASMPNDFHEHMEAGIQPHAVRERYYFCARAGQPFNRVVDISSHIEKKIDAIVECKSQGDGNRGALVRAQLAREGKRLPLLGNDDRTADRAYARQFLLDDDREYGKQHHLPYAERFYYIDERRPAKSKADEYIEKNAVRI